MRERSGTQRFCASAGVEARPQTLVLAVKLRPEGQKADFRILLIPIGQAKPSVPRGL